MKVGIVLENTPPEAGGGYTIKMDIAESILKIGAEHGHSCVLFSLTQNAPEMLAKYPTIPFVSLARSVAQRITSKLDQYTQEIIAKVRYPSCPPYVRPSFEQFCVDTLTKQGIEMVVYLEQNFFVTMDIPYMTIVFDLQHRLQPYFPEVSSHGAWEKREAFFKRCLQRATIVIAGTQAGKREIEQFFQIPSERIRILRHPTPSFAFSSTPIDEAKILAQFHLPTGYILYPAQFWSHKNHVGLLYAVKLLKDEYHLNFPVVFVGSDKGNLAYITHIVKNLQLNDHVHFLGFVPTPALMVLYRHAFALTYMTFFGPENLPPLEAFALGCPVIASNVSGAQEQLGDAALFVDPKNERELALAIKSLHENPQLRQTLVKRGLERASQWTSRDFAEGLMKILNEFAAIRRCWKICETHPREKTC